MDVTTVPGLDLVYGHVSATTIGIHEGLLAWVRARLRDAGHDTVEVYGQFPAQGTSSAHVVLFPFQVGPDPKLVEGGAAGPLLGPGRAEPPPHVPRTFVELGRLLTEALGHALGERTSATRTLADLPEPLAGWYRARRGTAWCTSDDGELVRLPALMWKPGLGLSVRYLAVAGEPGRGVSERTSVAAPVSLRALSVLAAAVHLERLFTTELPPQPLPDDLVTFSTAVLACAPEPLRPRLAKVLEEVKAPVPTHVAIHPVSEMKDEAFTNLMQALQRPLQATLVLQVRVMIAAFASFEPASSPSIGARVLGPSR